MLKIDTNYSPYVITDDTKYPNGKAKSSSSAASIDGTPLKAELINELLGILQATYKKAFGSMTGISGESENVENSDFLRALEKIIKDKIDNDRNDHTIFTQVEISGYRTDVTWETIGIEYDSESTYQVFVAKADNPIMAVLTFQTKVSENGISIFYTNFDGEKISSDTGKKKFGDFKWGENLWGDNTSMKVNLMIKKE